MQSKIIHKSCGKEKNNRLDNRVICRKFPGAVMTFPVLSVFLIICFFIFLTSIFKANLKNQLGKDVVGKKRIVMAILDSSITM